MEYIIRYQYLGRDLNNGFHTTDDWAGFCANDIKDALHQFWIEKDGERFFDRRGQHSKDYKIFDVLEFDNLEKKAKWQQEWRNNEPPEIWEVRA